MRAFCSKDCTVPYGRVPYDTILGVYPNIMSAASSNLYVGNVSNMITVPNKWPGKNFDNDGDYWKCRICGQYVSRERGRSCTRQSVRMFHTIARCAKGLRSHTYEVQLNVENKVTELKQQYSQCFLDFFGRLCLVGVDELYH
jgi:hypothetical protein